jgi:hypothetical protein
MLNRDELTEGRRPVAFSSDSAVSAPAAKIPTPKELYEALSANENTLHALRKVVRESSVPPGGGTSAISNGNISNFADSTCPPATQDVQINLKNRQNAIDTVGYGPLNPEEPNEEFWGDKAERWGIEIAEAKTAICGNCIFFVQTTKMLDCIESGLGSDEAEDASVRGGGLGYCNAFDFKCAPERTCNAWAAGGPVTDDTADSVTAAAKKRTKAQTPAPKKDQKKGSKKNPKGSAAGGKKITFSKSVTKSLENKVTEHNDKAPDGRRATLTMLKAVYRRGAGAYSTSHRPGQSRGGWAMARVNAFLRLLKSGKPSKAAYTQDNDLLPASHPRSTKKKTSVEPLLAGGKVLIQEEQDLAEAIYDVVQKHGKFDQDGDGVWAGYTPAYDNEDAAIGVKCANCVFYQGGDQCAVIALPVEPEGKCRFAILPEGAVEGADIPLRREDNLELLLASAYADTQLDVELGSADEYESTEDAILALTEFSGLGYESEFAFRASWLRAVRNGENPFKRASMLSLLGRESLDADLLPKEDDNE